MGPAHLGPSRHPRPQLDPAIIASFRRRRITEAMAELCVEGGYRAATVTKVASRARVSRATVYEHFDNREHILLAALDDAVAELLQRTKDACALAQTAGEPALEPGLGAVLDWIAERPSEAWVCFVEAFGATPQSMRRFLEALAAFATMLERALPNDVPRPATIEESLVGGVASLLGGRIRAGEAERAPELLPELATFIRGPFLS